MKRDRTTREHGNSKAVVELPEEQWQKIPPTLVVGVSEVLAAFSKYYMRRVATEFEDDLDRVRNAGDFDENALPQLVNALQQGVLVFSVEDRRRIGLEGMKLQEQ